MHAIYNIWYLEIDGDADNMRSISILIIMQHLNVWSVLKHINRHTCGTEYFYMHSTRSALIFFSVLICCERIRVAWHTGLWLSIPFSRRVLLPEEGGVHVAPPSDWVLECWWVQVYHPKRGTIERYQSHLYATDEPLYGGTCLCVQTCCSA